MNNNNQKAKICFFFCKLEFIQYIVKCFELKKNRKIVEYQKISKPQNGGLKINFFFVLLCLRSTFNLEYSLNSKMLYFLF